MILKGELNITVEGICITNIRAMQRNVKWKIIEYPVILRPDGLYSFLESCPESWSP
jgi:hypothetical protein